MIIVFIIILVMLLYILIAIVLEMQLAILIIIFIILVRFLAILIIIIVMVSAILIIAKIMVMTTLSFFEIHFLVLEYEVDKLTEIKLKYFQFYYHFKQEMSLSIHSGSILMNLFLVTYLHIQLHHLHWIQRVYLCD